LSASSVYLFVGRLFELVVLLGRGERSQSSRSGCAGRDPEQRRPAGQGAPERAVAAGGLPAGLVDVDDRRRLDLLLELRVGAGERLPGPLDELVDRPGRKLDPEQLAGELARVTPRDTVADRERHERGLQPRPERRLRPTGKLGTGSSGALRAADTMQSMLAHPDRDLRQLRDLMPPGVSRVDQLRHVEHMRTRPAALGPMLNDLVHPLRWKQPPEAALVAGLTTASAT
jgi:hypothetical protein